MCLVSLVSAWGGPNPEAAAVRLSDEAGFRTSEHL